MDTQIRRSRHTNGYSLVTALALVVLLALQLAAYFFITQRNVTTTARLADGTSGYYAAEAGLNARAARFASVFDLQSLPSGEPPALLDDEFFCATPGQAGSGEYACQNTPFNQRDVWTYVRLVDATPRSIRVPSGQPFAGLNAAETRFEVNARAENARGETEAVLGMRVKVRAVPLFQFLGYSNEDLEYYPGEGGTINGALHSNKNVYLVANAGMNSSNKDLAIDGQVSAGVNLYHGMATAGVGGCLGTTSIADAQGTMRVLPRKPGGCVAEAPLTPDELSVFGGTVRSGVGVIDTPTPDSLDPNQPTGPWGKADLRLVLNLRRDPPVVEARRVDGLVDAAATAAIAACGTEDSPVVRDLPARAPHFYDPKEEEYIRLLDVDVRGLLDCLAASPTALPRLDDSSDGGLVVYLGVDATDATEVNRYGVRVRNGATLGASNGTAARGLTFASDQRLYVQGDYNATNPRPAALMGDVVTVLSNAWSDANGEGNVSSRRASSTTIRAAVLAGQRRTTPGQLNGGLHNLMNLVEDWHERTLTYTGALVSLGEPRRTTSPFRYVPYGGYYQPPIRDFTYDTSFNDVTRLPPATPVMRYLWLERFSRDFDAP